MRRALIAAAALVVLLGASGCGEGVVERTSATSAASAPDDDDGASDQPDEGGICDALARVAAADRESGQASQGVTEWDELQPIIVDSSAEAVELYDAALQLAPDEIQAELIEIRELTEELGALAQEADSQEEFQTLGQELPAFPDSQAAVDELNSFGQRECGFTLANN